MDAGIAPKKTNRGALLNYLDKKQNDDKKRRKKLLQTQKANT